MSEPQATSNKPDMNTDMEQDEERKLRGSVVIHKTYTPPAVPEVAITRSSSHSNYPASSLHTNYSPKHQMLAPGRTLTMDSTATGYGFLHRPPTTPQGFKNEDVGGGYPFPYATRSNTNNDMALYRTTTSYSQWDDQHNREEGNEDDTNEEDDGTDGRQEAEDGEEGEVQDTERAPVPDRLNDGVGRARPAVDYQDMLWTQIDILDDVRRMADQSTEDGSFFSKEHTKALEGLKRAQYDLLKDLKGVERVLDSADDHRVIWESADIESVRARLYNREYFDGVKKGLEGVKERLDEVGESMRKVDERREE